MLAEPGLRPLLREDAELAARLHILGQPGTFLTQLGQPVLTHLYRALPAGGFGYVAICQEVAAADPAFHPGERAQSPEHATVCGFISGARSIGSLIQPMLMGNRGRAGAGLLARLGVRCLTSPRLIRYGLETLLYPLRARHPSASTGSPVKRMELLSIMVDPAYRSRGIGSTLLTAFVNASHARGADIIEVTVDAENLGARRFYASHEFIHQHDFTLYGRVMCLYRRPIS